MPTMQSQRNLIAKMKLLAVEELIRDKSLLLIDDSIVRGTQLRETTEFSEPERSEGGTYPSGMSAAFVWLQVSEFFASPRRTDFDHAPCHR